MSRNKAKSVYIRNQPLIDEVRAALERGVGVSISEAVVVEAALKDLRRRLSGELVPFENAALAVETIVKIRVEQSIGAYLGEEHPGEKISVQLPTRRKAASNSEVGDRARSILCAFQSHNKEASDSRSQDTLARYRSNRNKLTQRWRGVMTNKQKIEIRLSEVRSRLNEIAGIEGEAFTDEIRNEAAQIQAEYADLEVRHRAAITGEAEDEARMRGEFRDDAEGAEIRSLMGAVSIADYLTPASVGTGIEGRARELNAALKVEAAGKSGGVAVPWAVLAGPTPAPETARSGNKSLHHHDELRGRASQQRPILQRLFRPRNPWMHLGSGWIPFLRAGQSGPSSRAALRPIKRSRVLRLRIRSPRRFQH